MENKTSKICEICGDEFIPTQKTQKKCKKKHYRDCEICGKPFYLEHNRPQKTCSNTCASEYRKKNVSYEKECAFCGEKFTTTTKHTKFCNKTHYKECLVCGKTFVVKNLHRPSKTCSQSCGSSLSHNEESNKKRIENSIKKYGVENPFQSEKIKLKIKNSLEKSSKDTRFGSKRMKLIIKNKYNVENVSQLEEVKSKKIKTYQKLYDVDNPMQSKEVIAKRKEKMIERHGVDRKKYVNVSKKEEFMNLGELLEKNPMNIVELSEYFDVKIDKMVREIKEQDVLELVVDYYKIKSVKEEKFYNFLKTKHPTLKCIRNDRKVLDGKELDFYFPEKKVAVEISPTRTHNTIRGFADGPGVDKDYHKNKFIECEKKGIELITIFDWYDWEKSLEHIQAKLKMLPNKIYANATEYLENKYSTKEILEKSYMWSLSNANTIHKNQNKIKSGVLEYNNEILGIILWREENNVAIVNQILFKPYTLIVGGVSKLLKNLIKNNPEIKSIEIMSSSNLGSGFTYEKLGFTLIENREEQLNYYSEKYKTHISQLSEKKPIIINHENIGKYNFLPVYDCGYKKWRLKVN